MRVESSPARALFELSKSQPDREVLFDDQRIVTVQELAEWSAAVGDRVRGSGAPVLALVDRRVASVAACFGAAWGGRGVVPVDAAEPPTRILEYLERTGAPVVLDATGTVGHQLGGCPVIDVTAVGRMTAEPTRAEPDDVAVVFFTSGSTGRPKGTARTFATANALYERWSALNDAEGTDSGAVFLPMNFVGGYGPPMHASTVARRIYLIDVRTTPPERIADIVEAAGIRRLTVTPTMIRTLSSSLDGRRLACVDEVFGVGEPTDWSDVARVRSLASADVVYRTTYGASEIYGTVTEGMTIEPDVPIGVGRLPLGTMPGTDRARIEPVDGADGVGELVVRGALIPGYWGDPELTAERFGVDPDGVRFWRSGDLVRVDEDGTLHLIGRTDDMVKINGRLVEPAEPERVIRSVTGVRDAIVLARVLPSGRHQLVGHVEADATIRVTAVREALARELPGHLVPAVLVRHDRLPVLPRGKTDRVALRHGTVVPWIDRAVELEPTPLEAVLAGEVARVLGLETVAPDDDVWHIGCDSLAAIELVEIFNQRHGSHLVPNDLVDASTPMSIAALIEQGRRQARHEGPTVVRSGTAGDTVFLVCGAGGPAVQYRSFAMLLGGSVTVLEQRGLHRRGLRDRSVASAARRHLTEVRTAADSPVVLCGHSYGAVVANEMARLLSAQGRPVQLVLLDPVDASRAVHRRERPVNLRRRQGSVVLHLLKVSWWRLHHVGRRLRLGRPGTQHRYATFYRIGSRQARRHDVVAFEGPTMLVRAAAHHRDVPWPSMPRGEQIVVPGDHNTIVRFPYVNETARVVTDWITRGA